jgi:hypothetical protein
VTTPLKTRDAQRAALEQVEADEAERAKLFARTMARRAEVARLWEREHSGFAEMELAGTALIGQYRAARELDDSVRLRDILLTTNRLLADGVLFVPQAELLLIETRSCDERVQSQVDARLASRLIGRNLTDCRRLVASTILTVEAEIDPALTQQRLEAAKKNSRVWISPAKDGMTAIGAILDCVVGRRWTLDFEALVAAQRTLDRREGRKRTTDEVRAEVFAGLPSLVLALCRAARDGQLSELAEVAEVDPQAALELQQLALSTADLPLPAEPDGQAPEPEPEALAPEPDPYDETLAGSEPWAECSWPVTEPDQPPEPSRDPHEHTVWDIPPDVLAAQDAACRIRDGSPGHAQQLTDLLQRCLRMPLPDPAVITLHIPMTTALDIDQRAGLLEGYGPVPAQRIRALHPVAGLRNLYVDPDTGVPLWADRNVTPPPPLRDIPISELDRAREERARYLDQLALADEVVVTDKAEPQHDPSARLAAFVKTRDQKCPGPGCAMPASRCHLDHEREYPEGPTAEWNLADKSPRCHQAKHNGWTVHRDDDGSTAWQSPTGRTYRTPSPWEPPPDIPDDLQLPDLPDEDSA